MEPRRILTFLIYYIKNYYVSNKAKRYENMVLNQQIKINNLEPKRSYRE